MTDSSDDSLDSPGGGLEVGYPLQKVMTSGCTFDVDPGSDNVVEVFGQRGITFTRKLPDGGTERLFIYQDSIVGLVFEDEWVLL